MKKLLMTGIAAAAAFAAQALSLADASGNGNIARAAMDRETMTSTVKQLSSADAAKFLGRVNQAIKKLPGKAEEKTQMYLNANVAAWKGVDKLDRSKMIAETFATVPVEDLAALNGTVAANVINRNADPSRQITDEQMTKIAKDVLSKTQARTAGMSDAGVRDTFAAITMLRASNGTPENLRDTLVEMLDKDTREVAKNEWIPAAMGDNGQPKSYEPMLAAVDAGDMPEVPTTFEVPGALGLEALLADMIPGDQTFANASNGIDALPDPMGDGSGLDRVPRTTDPSAKWYGGYRRGDQPPKTKPEPDCHYVCEPGGYNCQWICGD